MSHFTVAVIHHPEQSIEELLAPFDENLRKDFLDLTEEVKEKYETDTIKGYRTKDGVFIDNFSAQNKYELLITEEQKKSPEFENIKATSTHFLDNNRYYGVFLPEAFGLVEADVSPKELYSFDEYAADYLGYEFDEDTNAYGYMVNQDAKWDWYDVGGRWNGMLRLKPECKGNGVYGNNGVFGAYREDDVLHCSEAYIKDIDFSPDAEEYESAKRWWEVVIENAPLKEGESKDDFFQFYKTEYYLERYGNAENYANAQASFSTFAILLPGGEWLEPGTMGWFGCSSASLEDEKKWDNEYMNIVNKADPNDILTIVDCHI